MDLPGDPSGLDDLPAGAACGSTGVTPATYLRELHVDLPGDPTRMDNLPVGAACGSTG